MMEDFELRNETEDEELIKKTISSILNFSQESLSQIEKLNSLSLYAIPNAFEGIKFFDVRFCMGSDNDHNLANGLLRWVLQEIEKLIPQFYRKDFYENFKYISNFLGSLQPYKNLVNQSFKDARKNIEIANIIPYALKIPSYEYYNATIWKFFLYFNQVWKYEMTLKFTAEMIDNYMEIVNK